MFSEFKLRPCVTAPKLRQFLAGVVPGVQPLEAGVEVDEDPQEEAHIDEALEAGPDTMFPPELSCSLTACSFNVPVYPYALAESSCLVYPYTIAEIPCLVWPLGSLVIRVVPETTQDIHNMSHLEGASIDLNIEVVSGPR
jgi:hypothetical protein